MLSYSWEKVQIADQLRTFASGYMIEHDGSIAHHPKPIQLKECPNAVIAEILNNAIAHPLIAMAHLDKNGYPFISIMGFSFNNGKINVTARGGALKQKRLATDPRCCFVYHNNISRPDQLACLTLVGKATVSHDPEATRVANEALCYKNYRDTDPDVERRAPMIAAMQRAERDLIILDEIEAVYIMSPMLKGTGSGIPTPVISWRADRKPQ
jgi:hypothetical protein